MRYRQISGIYRYVCVCVYDLYPCIEQNEPVRTIYILFHFHRALLSPDLCSCGCSCELGRAQVMDGRLLISIGTLLLKSSSSEQGDLSSASDLGIQPCREKEMLIHGAKDWPDTSRRERQVGLGEVSSHVRLSGLQVKLWVLSQIWMYTWEGRSPIFFKSSSPGMACWGETQLFYLPPGSTKDWQHKWQLR